MYSTIFYNISQLKINKIIEKRFILSKISIGKINQENKKMQNTEIQQLLEWYITAGVEEIVGDSPFAFMKEEKQVLPIAQIKLAKAEPSINESRQATTVLAQAMQNACQSAREICAQAQSLIELKEKLSQFDGCSLKLTASNMVFGEGNEHAKIMFIGEAPGADEDRIGRPFVGKSGQLLDKMIEAIGIKREDCYITNVLSWRPPGNRTPTDGEVAVCLPFLKRQIELISPEYIFLLGASAANALLNIPDSISKLRGHWLEYETESKQKIKTLASFHPAYLLRNTGQKAKAWSDLLRLKSKMEEK